MCEKNSQPSGAAELKEEQLEHVSGGTEIGLSAMLMDESIVDVQFRPVDP